MTRRAGLLALVAWLSALGCHAARATPSVGPSPGASATPVAVVGAHERVVHLTLAIEVEDQLAMHEGLLREEIARRGGYVESSERAPGRASLEIRVPSEELALFRRTVLAEGDVLEDHELVEDVTFTHVDVEARLRSAREEETRLLALYADRTASLADVLAVEHELARVRENVERLTSEDRAIADRVAMARVSLEVRERGAAWEDTPVASLLSAAGTGLGAALHLTLGIVAAVLFVGPSAALVLGLVVLARRLVRLVRPEPAG